MVKGAKKPVASSRKRGLLESQRGEGGVPSSIVWTMEEEEKKKGIGSDQFRRLGAIQSSGALGKTREKKKRIVQETVGPAASHMWYGHYDT